MSESTWIRVSRSEPCPVCDRPDYCTRTTDGTAVKCMRVESDQPDKGPLGGWIHKMADPLPPRPPRLKNRLVPRSTRAVSPSARPLDSARTGVGGHENLLTDGQQILHGNERPEWRVRGAAQLWITRITEASIDVKRPARVVWRG